MSETKSLVPGKDRAQQGKGNALSTKQSITIGILGGIAILLFATLWLKNTSSSAIAEDPTPGGKDFSTVTTTPPAATPAPTQAAQPTPTRVPNVPLPSANCPTTGQAQAAIGLKVVRTGTEACAWEYHSYPNVMHGNVPSGYVGTLTIPDGKGGYSNVVTDATQSWDLTDGTWRFSAAYPIGDPARDNHCGLWQKELQFGRQEDPSFSVVAGPGLNCDANGAPAPSGNNGTDTRAKCPEAIALASASNSWTTLGSNGWEYNGSPMSFTAPAGTVVHYDGGRATAGDNVPTGIKFSMYCER